MTQEDMIIANVREQLQTLPEFGQLQIFVKSHLGGIGKAEVAKITTTRYDSPDPLVNSNVEVVNDVISLIKSMVDAKLTGSLGFSVTFKYGQAETLAVQNFKKI